MDSIGRLESSNGGIMNIEIKKSVMEERCTWSNDNEDFTIIDNLSDCYYCCIADDYYASHISNGLIRKFDSQYQVKNIDNNN